MAPTATDIHCIERVTSLPLVKFGIGMATGGYGRIKNSSALVGGTLSRAEQSLIFVAETAKPMVSMLEKPISMADSIVCQGLDKLEEKLPAIKKSPEEVKDVGMQTYEDWKKYGTDKVTELKDYGVSKAFENPISKALISTVDGAVKLTETTVDHYLPAAESEGQDDEKRDDMNVVQRVTVLSEKMRRRMYVKVMSQMQGLQKRSTEALQNMNFTVDLIQYAKGIEETGRKKVAEGVDVVQEKAKWLWEELNKEEPKVDEDSKDSKTLDQHLLSLGRRVTKQAIVRYHEMSTLSATLPESIRKAIEMSTNYARDVYEQLTKATTFKEVSSLAIVKMWETAEMVQKMLIENFSKIIAAKPKEKTN